MECPGAQPKVTLFLVSVPWKLWQFQVDGSSWVCDMVNFSWPKGKAFCLSNVYCSSYKKYLSSCFFNSFFNQLWSYSSWNLRELYWFLICLANKDFLGTLLWHACEELFCEMSWWNRCLLIKTNSVVSTGFLSGDFSSQEQIRIENWRCGALCLGRVCRLSGRCLYAHSPGGLVFLREIVTKLSTSSYPYFAEVTLISSGVYSSLS